MRAGWAGALPRPTAVAGSVVVEYYFDNEPACQEEIDNGLQVSSFRLRQEP